MSDDIECQLARINVLDEDIVSLLNERAYLARKMSSLKAGNGIYAAQHEAEVLEHVSRCGNGLWSQSLCAGYTLKSFLPVAPWRND